MKTRKKRGKEEGERRPVWVAVHDLGAHHLDLSSVLLLLTLSKALVEVAHCCLEGGHLLPEILDACHLCLLSQLKKKKKFGSSLVGFLLVVRKREDKKRERTRIVERSKREGRRSRCGGLLELATCF